MPPADEQAEGAAERLSERLPLPAACRTRSSRPQSARPAAGRAEAPSTPLEDSLGTRADAAWDRWQLRRRGMEGTRAGVRAFAQEDEVARDDAPRSACLM